MTPNTKAKMPAFLLLGTVLPVALCAVQPLPLWLVMTITTVLWFAVGGAKDMDPTRAMFHGVPPAYWIPAATWLALVNVLCWVPAPAATVYAALIVGGLQSLAVIGWVMKNNR